jgi:hypothetical protein
MKFYAGIGDHKSTPDHVLEAMELLSFNLGRAGWTLRSGGAEGADTAFERGAERAYSTCDCGLAPHNGDGGFGPKPQIFLPVRNHRSNASELYTPSAQAFILAARFHPAWKYCGEFTRKLHARNMHIISGLELDSPASFVVCWTVGGKDVGGTGQGIRYARSLGIPIFNLFDSDATSKLQNFLDVNGRAADSL